MKNILFALAVSALAALTSVVSAGEDAKRPYDGYDGYYRHNFSKDAYSTPHLDWADKLTGKRLNILFINDEGGIVRHDIEFVQRFGVDWQIANPLGKEGIYEDAVSGGKPSEKFAQFDKIMKANKIDVYVVNNYLGTIPGNFMYEILRQVKEDGKGLVVLGRIWTWGWLTKKCIPVPSAPDEIGDLAPLNELPDYYLPPTDPEKAKTWKHPELDKLISGFRFGKGRILLVNDIPNPKWTVRWKAAFECRNVSLARMFFWAAQREPAAIISANALIANPNLPFGAMTLPVQIGFKWDKKYAEQQLAADKGKAEPPYSLKYRIRNTENQVFAEKEIKIFPGCNNLALPLPQLPAGDYYLDLMPKVEGVVADVGFRGFKILSPLNRFSLSVQDINRNCAPFSPRLSWGTKLQDDATLELTLADSPYGQVWYKASFPLAAGSNSFTTQVKDYLMPTLAGKLTARVIAKDGNVLEQASSFMYFPNNKYDIYTIISWDHLNASGLLELFAPQAAEVVGWTNNLGESENHSAIMNARSVPYIAHVSVGTSKDGGVSSGLRYLVGWGKEADETLAKLNGNEHPYRPEVREIMASVMKKKASVAAKYGVCVYNLGDECGYDVAAGFGPSDAKYFAEFLQFKYKTIDAFNKIANTSYKSFEEVPHLKPDAAKAAKDFRAWNDHVQYIEKMYSDTFKMLSQEIKKVDPQARVGAEGSQAGDLEQTIDKLEFWGPYRSKVADEVLRNIAENYVRGIWWGGYFDNPRDGFPLQQWEFILTGTLNADMWFQIEPGGTQSAFAGDFSLAPYVAKMLPHLQNLRWGVAQTLIKCPLRKDKIGMLYSHASSLASQLDERMVPPIDSQSAMVDFCYRNGLGVEFITRKTLKKMDDLKVLFIFGGNSLYPEEINAIRNFVKNGGLVVADMPPAFMNEYMQLNGKNPLEDIFGDFTMNAVKEPDVAAKLKLETEFNGKKLSLNASRVKSLPEIPFFAMRKVGKGESVLLNFTLSTAANTSKTAEFDKFLLDIIETRNIQPVATLSGLTPEYAIFRVREDGDMQIVGFKTITQDLGRKAIIDLKGKQKFIYEVNKGFFGQGDRIVIDKLDVPFKLYSLFDTKQNAPEIKLSADSVEKGEATAMDMTAMRKNGVYLLSVADPSGKDIQPRRKVIFNDGKEKNMPINFAFNDVSGKYTVLLKDIATGLTSQKTVTVK